MRSHFREWILANLNQPKTFVHKKIHEEPRQRGQIQIQIQSHHTSQINCFLQASHNKGWKGSCTPPIPRLETAENNFIAPCCVSNPTSLLSPQLHTKSPLQFAYNLLIRNGFSRFILLNYLGLLIDHLQEGKKKFKASPELKFKVSLDVREWERGTCASWAWVSFLSILACIIAFFSSVGTRSSVGDQNVLESFSSNGKHHTTCNQKKKSNLGKK